jgi:DNA-binding transcriptional LysR family regulator
VRKIHMVITMRNLPPLNSLRVFEAAARCLSFSAAAEELCVTHSAVSHQMRLLESWLGRTLFVRHPTGVRLTDAGQMLLQASAQALGQIERCCAEIQQRADVSEITLGAPGSFLSHWLIPRLEQFEEACPQLRIRLQTCSSLEELQRQRVDAQIITGQAPWPKQIVATSLFDELTGPVCAPDWPLLQQPSDLIGQPLLHTSSREQAWGEWALAQQLDQNHFSAGRRFDHLPQLLAAAAAGLGVAIAPALLVERELAQHSLVAPLGFVACGASFSFCLSASRAGEAKLLVLRDWLLLQAQGDRQLAVGNG